MSDTNAPVIDGQGAASAAPAAAQAPAQQAATPAIPWLPNADEITTGYVQNKGWTEPGQVLDGYRNLEKLLGADRAGNTVVLPKFDAPAEEWAKVYDRMGRPSDAAGYKLEIPESIGNKEFAGAAAAKFHELGLTAKQGQELASWWNQTAQAQTAQTQEARQLQFNSDEQALKTEWGQAYQQNLTQAQAAVRGMGLTAEQIDALAGAWGHKTTMQFFQNIGSRMGESELVTGGKTERFGSALTPGQAKAQIQQLQQDKSFVAKLVSKDAEASARWTQLHQFAYPDGA